jgi:hypothetical protein
MRKKSVFQGQRLKAMVVALLIRKGRKTKWAR